MEDYARTVDELHPAFGVIAASSTTTDTLAVTLGDRFGGATVRPNLPDASALVHGGALAALALVIGMPLGWLAQQRLGNLLTSEIGIGPGLMFGPAPAGLATIAVATLALGALATSAALWPSLHRSPDTLLQDE